MFDKAALRITKPFVDTLARRALRQGLHADQVTLIGFGFGMASALLIAIHHPMLAIVPLLLGRLCDGMDGAMARMASQQTDRGAFLDIALDFLFYASIPLAFVVADPGRCGLAGSVLLTAFVATGTSFLAYSTIAAKRGETSTAYPTKGIYYLGGITEGTETIALFIAFCIWPEWFAPLAYIYAALCLVTTFTRVQAGWRAFG